MGPRRKSERHDGGEWQAPDEAEVQHGASWDELTEEDQRLLSMAESAEAFDRKPPASIPEPPRAPSSANLPKVKSGTFPRLIR